MRSQCSKTFNLTKRCTGRMPQIENRVVFYVLYHIFFSRDGDRRPSRNQHSRLSGVLKFQYLLYLGYISIIPVRNGTAFVAWEARKHTTYASRHHSILVRSTVCTVNPTAGYLIIAPHHRMYLPVTVSPAVSSNEFERSGSNRFDLRNVQTRHPGL
jgi:hypothetical protein